MLKTMLTFHGVYTDNVMDIRTNFDNFTARASAELPALAAFVGSVLGLDTTATNLVDAINEVKVTADAGAGSGLTQGDKTIAYNTAGDVETVTEIDSDTSDPISTKTLTYNSSKVVTSVLIENWLNSIATTKTFTIDSNNRITNVTLTTAAI